MGCCQRRTSCSKAASSPRCQRVISSASCGGTIVPPTTGCSKNAGGGQTDDGPSEFVRVVQAVTGISTRMSRLLSEPLPPTPLPEAERGVGGRGCPTARKGQEFGKGISRSLAELELVVHRDHVLVAVRGRRFVLGICLLAGLLVFLDHLEVAHVFLFLLACLGAAPGRGRAALGRTGTSLNEPAQR